MKAVDMFPRGVPDRFLVNCTFCGGGIDMRAPGVHQFVQGWVKNRTQGGSNAVVFTMPLGAYACEPCIDAQRHGQTGQGKLFA